MRNIFLETAVNILPNNTRKIEEVGQDTNQKLSQCHYASLSFAVSLYWLSKITSLLYFVITAQFGSHDFFNTDKTC